MANAVDLWRHTENSRLVELCVSMYRAKLVRAIAQPVIDGVVSMHCMTLHLGIAHFLLTIALL